MNLAGLPTMLYTHARTNWVAVTWWIVGIVGLVGITVGALLGTYNTDEKIATYAASVEAAGTTMYMMNGRIAGLDNVGGIAANELSLIMSLCVPLMAIALVSRATRKDEESGRWELLLASPVSRVTPLVSAVLVALSAMAILAVAVFGCLVSAGVQAGDAALYALGQFGIGAVFVGVTTITTQIFDNSRAVFGATFGVLLALFVARGLGAVNDNATIWFTPLGWGDELRPFGESRAWPLVLLFTTAAVMLAAGWALARGRDSGAALLAARPGSPEASSFLRTPVGLAAYLQRGGTIGWAIGITILMVVYGSLASTVVETVKDNPELAEFFGGDVTKSLDPVLGVFLMVLSILTAAYGISASGILKQAESTGRAEAFLATPVSRGRWLGVNTAVIGVGMVIVWALGTLGLAVGTAATMNDNGYVGDVLSAALAYLPGAMLMAALGVALFGALPRFRWVAWLVFGVTVVIAYMGPVLKVPERVVDRMPYLMAGNVPLDDVNVGALAVALALTAALVAVGIVSFQRRDITTG